MQAGGRLVEDVEHARLALVLLAARLADVAQLGLQVRRQLHALRLAAGERGRRLPQPQIAQADFLQHAQLLHDLGHAGEEVQRLLHRQVQHVVNVLAVIANLQHFRLVARALALLADQLHVGQELHLHRDRAVALAGFAAAAGNVEGEMSRGVAALLALRQRGEQLADGVERLDVGHRIGARRAADGRLIDQHDFVDPLRAFHALDLGAADRP